MDAFTAGLLQRIRNTETDIEQARESGDDFLVEVEQAELEDLRRLAEAHGVPVEAGQSH
ncbi:LarC family nickel insertion protein [Streptomyces sp. A7024]|uniref:LarC family nickel insertion protein n=1 Tax=Streptomyces coryli TaxID=1128680 RepID=A0A6G4U3Q2_9ACTN|nr:LarC family nickel insertion protein [Streptomyces coryli]NGN66713.1 LarC family nickel insertion protein [Streptomyces coryli]